MNLLVGVVAGVELRMGHVGQQREGVEEKIVQPANSVAPVDALRVALQQVRVEREIIALSAEIPCRESRQGQAQPGN